MLEALYQPSTNEKQLTIRAILAGCLLGSIISMINIYMGLKTGWMIPASLITAILGFAALKPLFPEFSVLENNITATAGSAAGGMSTAVGMMNFLPALDLLNTPMTTTQVYIWGFSVAFIGIFFIVPLRRQLLLVEKLRFPTGVATAETIVQMHKSQQNNYSARYLLAFTVFSVLLILMCVFLPSLEHINLFSIVGLSVLGTWGFNLLCSPMIIGIGMIVGLHTALSLLLGAIIAWGLLAPIVIQQHWVVNPALFDYRNGVQSWLMWPGVSILTADSLMALVLGLPKLFHQKTASTPNAPDPEQIPTQWWLRGLVVTSIMCMFCLKHFFRVPIIITGIGILISGLMATMAARAMGETDINPLSTVTKVTQLVYAKLLPNHTAINLMGAGLTSAGATSSADLMANFKTGLLLGASQQRQFITQLVGSFCGILFSVPLYFLFKDAYHIGSPDLPAPTAQAWKAFAEILTKGTGVLPHHSIFAIVAAAIASVAINLISCHPRLKKVTPSCTALGIAFIVPAYYPMAFCAGALLLAVWQWQNSAAASRYVFPVASGLIAGEGLMGIIKASLILWAAHSAALFS